MKFTNVKQLIIKFMGGGLINFPTRFLRWVKINGDTDDSDGGSDDEIDAFNGDYFFPVKNPFIGLIDDDILNSIDFDNFDWENPQNNPVYTVDTLILKTMSDVDSYINSLNLSSWPRNKTFLALYNYDIDDFYLHSVPAQFEIHKEGANVESTYYGPYPGETPIKLNINNKTFVAFFQNG